MKTVLQKLLANRIGRLEYFIRFLVLLAFNFCLAVLLSHRAYQQYLVHNPLAEPQRLTDLIVRGRQLAALAGAGA